MFKEGYREYTSWYMDGGFVSQFGAETSSLRPQGRNPPDDFHFIACGTSTALSTLTINHMGAEARLRIGVDNTRRLWRIKKNYGKREAISPQVQLLSDGSSSPWNVCNCHLLEIPLKERHVSNEREKEYLLKCLNPDNQFSEDIEEEVTYSKEHGCLIQEETEVPRTIFLHVWNLEEILPWLRYNRPLLRK
jgi:hypothetical protein